MKLTGTGRVASPLRDLRRELTQGDVPFALLQTAPERWPLYPGVSSGCSGSGPASQWGDVVGALRRFFSLTPTPNACEQRNQLKLSAMDASARVPMKDAAKCDTHCELQNSVSHQISERTLHSRGHP